MPSGANEEQALQPPSWLHHRLGSCSLLDHHRLSQAGVLSEHGPELMSVTTQQPKKQLIITHNSFQLLPE